MTMAMTHVSTQIQTPEWANTLIEKIVEFGKWAYGELSRVVTWIIEKTPTLVNQMIDLAIQIKDFSMPYITAGIELAITHKEYLIGFAIGIATVALIQYLFRSRVQPAPAPQALELPVPSRR